MAQDRFPYQAVIFDMDGVIVDTERFYFDQLDEMYTAAGMPVSHEELSRAVGASYKDFQKNLARWFAMGGVELSIEEAKARYDEWAKDHPADYASLLNPGVVETVAALKENAVKPFTNDMMFDSLCGVFGLKEWPFYNPKNDISSFTYDRPVSELRTMYGDIRIDSDPNL